MEKYGQTYEYFTQILPGDKFDIILGMFIADQKKAAKDAKKLKK